MMRRAMIGAAVAAAVSAAAGPALASGGGAAEAVPTFTKDVAPILFDNCVTCHRSGNIAPMSLTSYAETRPWTRSIKDLVVSRTMPPWPADPDNSLAFRNERRLDQAQIDTIAAWVDGGAPRGLAADLPALPDFPEGWTYEGGDPDYVFELPVEYTVAAEEEEDYLDFYSAMPWEEDRFAEVLELRPSNYAVVHHSGAYVVDLPAGKMVVDGVLVDDPNAAQETEEAASGAGRVAQRVFNEVNLPGTSKLLSYVPGRGVERHRPGTRGRDRATGEDPEHSALPGRLEDHRHHADCRADHAVRPVAPHASAGQEPEVGGDLSGRS